MSQGSDLRGFLAKIGSRKKHNKKKEKGKTKAQASNDDLPHHRNGTQVDAAVAHEDQQPDEEDEATSLTDSDSFHSASAPAADVFNIAGNRATQLLKPDDVHTVPESRLGLFLMNTYNPQELKPGPDYIAVHGLMGDYDETWTKTLKSGEKVRWLRDMLPESIPTAWIFSYSYDAAVLFSKSKAKMEDYAMALVNQILVKRSGKDTAETKALSERPLIFICHSLGGLVVKKVQFKAHSESGVSYKPCLDNSILTPSSSC